MHIEVRSATRSFFDKVQGTDMPKHDDLLHHRYVRIAWLMDSARQTLRDNPHEAVALAEQALSLARATQDYPRIANCLELYCGLHLQQSPLQNIHPLLTELVEIRKQLEDDEGKVVALLLLGQYQWQTGEVRAATATFNYVLEFSSSINYTTGHTDALELLARFHTDLGDYVMALDWYLRLLRFINTSSAAPDIRGGVISNIGALYGQMGNYPAALEHFTQALAIFTGSGNAWMQARMAGNMAATHHALHQNDRALEYGLRALALYQELSDRRDIPRLLMTIASILEQQGHIVGALDYLKRALDGLEDQNDDEGYIGVLLSLGGLHRKAKNLHQGIYLLEEALRQSQSKQLSHLEFRIHEALSAAFEELGDNVRALNHHKQFARLRDQFQDIEKQKAIATLQLRFDVERAQQELQILRLQSERLQAEAEQKERELRAIALNLVERNQFIEDIRLKLTQLAEINSNGHEALKQLIRQLHSTNNADKAWRRFEDQFEQVHHDFMQSLARRFPDLSNTERKVCALIRAGLSTKDIAQLLHIEDRTVEQHRFRIRRKLRLSTEVNLTTYIAGL